MAMRRAYERREMRPKRKKIESKNSPKTLEILITARLRSTLCNLVSSFMMSYIFLL